MVTKEIYYTIALSMMPGIGHIGANKLLNHCESAENLFDKQSELLFEISKKPSLINIEEVLSIAKTEVDYILENNIKALIPRDPEYPYRLKECADKPIVLYCKGEMELNRPLVISIVGSRNASIRGQELCRSLVADLAVHDPLIISGLAFGIDITAHRSAIENELQTVGVIGSGLKIIYPEKHGATAHKMMENGGLVSDYPSETKLLPSQFAERNRLVAGLADLTIVVESSSKGGSMITASLAMDYNREVAAFPGRPNDELSKGCNQLIKSNRAALIESAKDVEYLLKLDQKEKKHRSKQTQMFVDLSHDEQLICNQLSRETAMPIDEISNKSGQPISKTSVILLELEFKGVISSLPGKQYQLL